MENKQSGASVGELPSGVQCLPDVHNKIIAVERLRDALQHLAKSRVDLFCVLEGAVYKRIDEIDQGTERNNQQMDGYEDVYLYDFYENGTENQEDWQLFEGYDLAVVEDDFAFEPERIGADLPQLSMSRVERRKLIEPPKRRMLAIFTWMFALAPFAIIIGLYFYSQSLIIIEKPAPDLGEKIIIHLPTGRSVYTYEKYVVYEHDRFYYEGERNKVDLTGGIVVYEEWE